MACGLCKMLVWGKRKNREVTLRTSVYKKKVLSRVLSGLLAIFARYVLSPSSVFAFDFCVARLGLSTHGERGWQKIEHTSCLAACLHKGIRLIARPLRRPAGSSDCHGIQTPSNPFYVDIQCTIAVS